MKQTRSQSLSRLLSSLGQRLELAAQRQRLRRSDHSLVIFFHGDSLAHTIRPLVMGRALRARGYPVTFAGAGKHQERIAAEGFDVQAVETMPQSRMDEYVSRSDYGYYDQDWIERCVASERGLIRRLRPHLVIGDMRPVLRLSSALEGVDAALVEAGYNQPGYPFPIRLPASFPLGTEQFAEYTRRHASELRPHRLLHLVADVPEFHPAGPNTPSSYQYIGPLIDVGSGARSGAALKGARWDKRRPLIYLNVGSTGAPPEFLGDLLALLARSPYRVLVTTSGRWHGESPSDQIHIVDFVPASRALRHASLLVGIGGIGSIYHALRQGVPVVGAPEHLDQEYHLRRVQDLGLGLRLDWADFLHPQSTVAAIEEVLGAHERFSRRCKEFARHVRAWDAGDAAAAVVDGHFISRAVAHQISERHLVSEPEFVRHLMLSTPPELEARHIQQMLRDGVARGMPHARQGGMLFYDRADSWNWLYDQEPRFFEPDYRTLEEKRQVFFARQNGAVRARRESQRYRLTYTLRVFPRTLPETDATLLFLPYPTAGEHQSHADLRCCDPPGLREYLIPRAGFFYAYPVARHAASGDALDYSYTCEVTVDARIMDRARTPQATSTRQLECYAERDPELADAECVQQFFQEHGVSSDLPSLERARRIYRGLACAKRFQKTKESCQCLACSTHQVLSEDGGHCITISHAYIALCRVAGVPAREVTGALAGYPAGEGRYEMAVFNEMLFGHTWCEVFIPEYGWLPVEFHGIVIGPQANTGSNVRSRDLSEMIVDGGGAYVEYYFGNLDCHRVVCSDSVKKIPQLMVREQEGRQGAEWTSSADVRHESKLVFECI